MYLAPAGVFRSAGAGGGTDARLTVARGGAMLRGGTHPVAGTPPTAVTGGSVSVRMSNEAEEGRVRSETPTEAERQRERMFSGVIPLVMRRTTVLVFLMLLQSMSQFILENFEKLVTEHLIVPLFLTMLVGAGGNAGNQAAVHSITGLVTGTYSVRDCMSVVAKEIVTGLCSAVLLSLVAVGRVYFLYDPSEKHGDNYLQLCVLGVTLSLFCIVLTSMVIGGALPFLFEMMGLNREHAAPCIQVIMDIMGVYITCQICTYLLLDTKPVAVIPMKPHGNT
eukprot:TRINITY_DN1091_c0_g2_i1.p1 TRINITY_DN1091_c0_g2~~TRINITY_DN1091_c0_g2_i1.p1  ORF type:complete len:279 (+),score=64.25 TRINITY_DN1091_c0_g2_i1:91-927(+)